MFSEDSPRTWSEMSFEFKGMFAYHVVMMVMMLAGGGLALIGQMTIAAAIVLVIALASVIRRLRHKWRWQGVTPLRAGGAVLVITLMGYFLFAAAGGALQEQGLALQSGLGPWALAGFGIAVFSVLNVLRITHMSEKAFREECGEQAARPKPEPPAEPRWKAITKYAFIALFIAIWLGGVTFFYVHDRAIRAGSPTPTVERSIAFTNKGVTVYITPAEKLLIDQLQSFMSIGVPAAILTGFVLHFVLRIRFDLVR